MRVPYISTICCLHTSKSNHYWFPCMCFLIGDIVAWWLRCQTSMPEVVRSIPAHGHAQVRPHCNTLRRGMNPWLLPDCTESGSICAQNVQHLEIHWRFNGVLSPGDNVRLVKSCEWLPQPVQDYKPIPLPLCPHLYGLYSCQRSKPGFSNPINETAPLFLYDTVKTATHSLKSAMDQTQHTLVE